jgi:adenylate cyclase
MRENLTFSQKATQLVHTPVKNITAYTHYLKGLHYWNKLTPADTYKSVDYFEQAIALEPGYAAAYARAAAGYSYLGATGQMSAHKAFEIVHRYADKAMQLDNTIAGSYIAKAGAYLFYDWKWDEAHKFLLKAVDINPSVVEAYQLLGYYYIIKGQKTQAVKMMEEAVLIDPLSSIINQALGNIYVFAERFDDAIRQADKLLEMDPQLRIAIELKAWATGMKGDWEKALILFTEFHRLTNHPLKGLMGMGFAYTRLGQNDKALECIRKMEQRQVEEPGAVIDADLAAVWFGLGDLDKTFYYIHQCIDKRIGPVSYFLEYPTYKAIKEDPRYNDVKKRLGLQ